MELFMKWRRKMLEGRGKCPACGSTNIKENGEEAECLDCGEHWKLTFEDEEDLEIEENGDFEFEY